MFQLVGLVLQAIGIAIILISQVIFFLRTRRKWGSLKKALLDLNTPRAGFEDEELLRMSQTELKKTFKKFPFAKFIYEDFIISFVGLFCSLIGILLYFIQ